MSTTTLLQNPKIVSREEWLAARRQLLTEESGWGYDAVVCADSVGNDQGDSAEPAQHDSIHRPVKLAGLAEGPAVRQFLHQRGGLIFLFSSVEIDFTRSATSRWARQSDLPIG